MSYVLGIDIGGTHTRYGIVGTNETLNIKKTFTDEIEDFIDFISSILQESEKEIDCISIGIPGIVKNNQIISAPNLKKLEDLDFATKLSEKTNKKVIISKDVNLLFEYHIHHLNLINIDNILAFYLGTGLGNVIRVNGQILKGENGFAGELGHIPVIGNKQLCGCGKTGCLETIVSGKALVDLHQTHFHTTPFKALFTIHRNDDLIKEFILNFAKAISLEMNIFDTPTIIIGGGVVNMTGFPKELLLKQIGEETREPSIKNNLNIMFVDDLPINGIIGANIVARRYL